MTTSKYVNPLILFPSFVLALTLIFTDFIQGHECAVILTDVKVAAVFLLLTVFMPLACDFEEVKFIFLPL